MKYIIKKISYLVIFFLPLLTAKAQITIDKIAAKVDNYIILKSEIETAYQQMITANKGSAVEVSRCKAMEQLIINKIMVAKAEIDSVKVEDARVDQELDRRMQYFIMQAGGEDKLVKTYGSSIAELKEFLRDQVKEQLAAQKMQSEITKDVNVTPSQVKKYYSRIPKDSIPFLSAEVQVGQIVKFPEVSKTEKDKVRKRLLDFRERILNGESFEAFAKQYSEDYGSARKGGELGWHGRSELVPEFEATALQIEIGEISEPIESDFGFHLIQLLERRGNRFNSRHILIRPKPSEQDIKATVQLLDSVRTMVLLDSMTFEEAAKDYSDDQPTRANAGYFKDEMTGSSSVATDGLDPIIFFTVDTMQINTITKPIRFRTEDGKAAVRLIYYKNYRPPHPANMTDDYQKLAVAALNDKKAEIVKKWLKKAKTEVFIDIDPEYDQCNIVGRL